MLEFLLITSHTPNALSYPPLATEDMSKKQKGQRIREVEHGCLSPLVLSASGGMGPTAKRGSVKLPPSITSHTVKQSLWL